MSVVSARFTDATQKDAHNILGLTKEGILGGNGILFLLFSNSNVNRTCALKGQKGVRPGHCFHTSWCLTRQRGRWWAGTGLGVTEVPALPAAPTFRAPGLRDSDSESRI